MFFSKGFDGRRDERGNSWNKRQENIEAFSKIMNAGLNKRKKSKEITSAAMSNSTNGTKKISICRAGMEHQDGASSGSKKRLSEEEYAQVKKRKKENDLLRKEWPRIFVNKQDRRSSLSTESERVPLYMGDVQSLLFFTVLGRKSPVVPRWVTFLNITKVSHVVMIHIEGIGLQDIKQNTHTLSQGKSISTSQNENEHTNQQGNSVVNEGPNSNKGMRDVNSSGGLPDWLTCTLPRSTQHMNHSMEIVAPSLHGACPVDELLQMKSEKTTKRVIEEDMKNYYQQTKTKKMKSCESFIKFLSTASPRSDDNLHPNDKYNRLKLLLTPGDLAKNNFPLPLPGYRENANKDFVLTSDNYSEVTSRSPMFGLDCEMCLTSIQKLELTSISIVNEKLELVYHTLVLPYNPVVNFLTKFSGITPDMLLNVTKRLEDVQKDLQKLLPPDAILVGHSLHNDFIALKMMHPYVIDSSLAYNLSGNAKRPSSLKMLCGMFLNERIQTAGQGGHDPTEDAIGSLKLIQFKLKKDESYGNVLMGWEPPSAFGSDWQKCKPDTQEEQQQESGKDTKHNTKEQQEEHKAKESSEEAIGPFNRKDIYIFQKMESCNIAIITTAQCLKSYLGPLASLNKMPTVEVVAGNKQVSQRAGDFMSSYNLTYVHMEMGKKMSQCPDETTRQRQLTKLDKRLQRIHMAAPPKSIHIYVFSGSSLLIPYRERCNGFVLVGIKGLPFKT